MKQRGIILYQGPSMIDGAPIVAVATFGSTNRKTGGMIQTWIIRSDVEPNKAVKSGEDASVCGSCPHRGTNGKGRSCYVVVYQAPLSVYRAYHRGAYATLDDVTIKAFEGAHLRMGSYGDPAAVPFAVWESLISRVSVHTGYTHQWRTFPAFCGHLMASCDSITDFIDAHAMGWQTFRVITDGQNRRFPETICLAESHGKTCDECRICSGNKCSVVIHVHGAGKRNFKGGE